MSSTSEKATKSHYPPRNFKVQWGIRYFKKLLPDVPDDGYYDSPVFPFLDNLWHFRMWPKGNKEQESTGWIGLYLMRQYTGPPVQVAYKLCIEKDRPSKYLGSDFELTVLDSSATFDDLNPGRGYAKCLETSQITKENTEYIIGCTFSVICYMKPVVPRLVSTVTRTVMTPHFWTRRFCVFCRNLLSVVTCRILGASVPEVATDGNTVLEDRSDLFAAMFRPELLQNRTGHVRLFHAEPDVLLQVWSDIAIQRKIKTKFSYMEDSDKGHFALNFYDIHAVFFFDEEIGHMVLNS